MKNPKASKRKRAAAVSSSAFFGHVVKLSMDGPRINAAVVEVARLTQSLERLLNRVRGIILRLRSNDARIGVSKPTFRACHFVCVPQIFSRDFELLIATLRALQLDGAHKIFNGTMRPSEQAYARPR